MIEYEGYPTDDEGRALFWNRQIEYALVFYKPYFDAGDELTRIYDARGGTDREVSLDIADSLTGRVRNGIMYAWVDQTISNLQNRNPVFKVKGSNKFSVNGAPVAQAVTNYHYTETEQFYHDERCLLDSVVNIWGVKKLGWSSRFIDKEKLDTTDLATGEYVQDDPEQAAYQVAGGTPIKPMEYQDHDAMIEAAVKLLQDPTLDATIKDVMLKPYIEVHKTMLERPTPEQNVTIQYDAPYGVRWHPKRFLMDPFNEHGLLDARWIAFGWSMPIPDVMSHPKFKNLDCLTDANVHQFEGAPNPDDRVGFDDFGYISGWEIYARNFPVSRTRRADLKVTVVPECDKPLEHDEKWPFTFIEDYPCSLLTLQTSVDNFINKPQLHLAGSDSTQLLVNEFMDATLGEIRKQKHLVFYDKDLFEGVAEGDFTAVLNAPSGTAFAVEGLAEIRGKAVDIMPVSQVPNDRTAMINMILGMNDRAAGTPQPTRYLSPDSATEAAIIEKRTASRENKRAEAFKKFQVDTARKFWQLVAEFRPERTYLIDPRADLYLPVTEEMAQGEFSFRIDVSGRAESQAVEAKKWNDLLNLMVGITPTLMQLGFPPPNLMEIVERLLVNGYDVQDVESILPGLEQDPAMAVAMQDPMARQAIVDHLGNLKGGGAALTGGGPGPINPQQFAAGPANQRPEVEPGRPAIGG